MINWLIWGESDESIFNHELREKVGITNHSLTNLLLSFTDFLPELIFISLILGCLLKRERGMVNLISKKKQTFVRGWIFCGYFLPIREKPWFGFVEDGNKTNLNIQSIHKLSIIHSKGNIFSFGESYWEAGIYTWLQTLAIIILVIFLRFYPGYFIYR